MMQLKSVFRLASVLLLTASLTFAVGCDDGKDTGPGSAKKGKNGENEHPSEGPHGGGLIELGDEEYHGEIVHKEDHDKGTSEVTIYILDSSAKNAVPIEAETVIINARIKGEPKQFELKASPMEGDEAGKSSRFHSTEEALGEALDTEDAEPRLQVTIEGTQYSGKIPHDHEHEHEE